MSVGYMSSGKCQSGIRVRVIVRWVDVRSGKCPVTDKIRCFPTYKQYYTKYGVFQHISDITQNTVFSKMLAILHKIYYKRSFLQVF